MVRFLHLVLWNCSNSETQHHVDAIPLRRIPLNKVPFVPNNMPLLGILDKFQEGKSHMAIVSRFSVEKAASVKKVVKRGLTQRLRESVGISDSSDEDSDTKKDDKSEGDSKESLKGEAGQDKDLANDTEKNGNGKGKTERGAKRRFRRKKVPVDLEMGVVKECSSEESGRGNATNTPKDTGKDKLVRISSYVGNMGIGATGLEQSMPADAVLTKKGADEVSYSSSNTAFLFTPSVVSTRF
jgi:metal transporter CNNM